MSWTGHGHQIPNTTVSGIPPRQVARCGGPGACKNCSEDALRVQMSTDVKKPLRYLPQND